MSLSVKCTVPAYALELLVVHPDRGERSIGQLARDLMLEGAQDAVVVVRAIQIAEEHARAKERYG